jgi:hypothetical protein
MSAKRGRSVVPDGRSILEQLHAFGPRKRRRLGGQQVRTTRLGIAALALALITACSSGGSSVSSSPTVARTPTSGAAASGTPTSGVSSTSTSDPRPPQQIAADKATAQAAVLKLADLPAGWTGTAPTDTGTSSGLDAQLAACLGTTASISTNSNPTHVDSDDFSDPSGDNTVSNSVALLASADATKAVMDALSNPKVPGCLAQTLDDLISQNLASSGTTLPAGTSVGHAQAALESFPNVADRTLAFRITVPVQAGANTVNINVDFVAFTKGRAGSTLSLQGTGSPFPTDLATSLAQTVAGRLPST